MPSTNDSTEGGPNPTDEPGEFRPLMQLLMRVWQDVNGRVWEERSDDWSKVLRTFRSKRANYYSRRFGWFHSAILTVLSTSATVRGPDMQLIRLFRALDVSALSRLAGVLQKGLAKNPADVVDRDEIRSFEDKERQLSELNAQLLAFSNDLCSLVDRYPVVLNALRAAHSEALWAGIYDDAVEEPEWVHLAFELRKQGFEPAEIAPLVDALPQATALASEPLRRRDLARKARNRIRTQTDRVFLRLRESKPSQGWGAHGSRADACAVLSLRACSDADDDDTDRAHAAGGSEGRVPLAPRDA